MEHVACSLCGADDAREVFRLRNDRYLSALAVSPPTSVKVMCRRCGHVYQDPQLDADELTRLYRDVYRSPALGYRHDGPGDEYLYWKTLKAQRDHAWLGRHSGKLREPGKALEIGCGEGLLLSLLSKDGWHVMGVDALPAYAAYARNVHGLEVLTGAFEDVDLAPYRFDLVIALAVLEHVKDPLSFLAKIARLLNPNGVLYIAVPNVLWLGDDPDNRISSPHLCLFTPATLRRMLSKAGFRTFELDDGSELLTALAAPAESSLPAPDEALPLSLGAVRRAILKCWLRSRMLRGIGVARRMIKRGLYRLFGHRTLDRVIARIRSRGLVRVSRG